LLRPALQAADGFLLLRHGVFGMGGRCRRGVAPVCIRARANDCASGHAKKRPQAALPFLPCARGRGWSGEYGGSPAEVGRHSGRAFLEEVERIGTQCVRDVTRMSQMCLGRRPQREARRHWACSRFAGDCSRTWRLRFMRIARAGREMGLRFFPQRTPGDAGGRRGAGRYETLTIRALARGGGPYRSAFCRPRFVAAPRWSRASRGKPGTTISASLASIPKIFRSCELLLFAPAKSSSSKEQAHETHWSVPFSRRRIGRGLLCLAA
jgi:hypothetical protein